MKFSNVESSSLDLLLLSSTFIVHKTCPSPFSTIPSTPYHPELFAAIEQDIEAEDDTGIIYHFKGSAVATAQLPSWPNNILVDSVFR